MMQAAEILATNTQKPWQIFSAGDQSVVEREFRALARNWHPDISKDDGSVFVHLVAMREAALQAISEGKWNAVPEISFTGLDGRRRSLKYVSSWHHDAGQSYLGNSHVMHVLSPDMKGMAERVDTIIKNLDYRGNADMKAKIGCSIPEIITDFQAETGEYVIVAKKPKNSVRMTDLVRHLGGKLDPRHVAWILRRCVSLACFMKINDFVHPDISMETCFVDPENHVIYLVGGWWFADHIGSPLTALPARSVQVMPIESRQNKTLDEKVGLEPIHLLGRELLGNKAGVGVNMQSVPKALLDWANMPAEQDAFLDYDALENAVDAAFGKRTFVKMNVDINKIEMEN